MHHPEGPSHLADTLGIAAAAWGVLMAISPLLQIRRMVERRSSADVSIAYLAVLEFGFLLWIGYGISLGNPVIADPELGRRDSSAPRRWLSPGSASRTGAAA